MRFAFGSRACRALTLFTGVILIALTTTLSAASDARLVAAARSGEIENVRALLKGGAPVDSAEPDGTTALHWAVRADNVEMVRTLLRAGARAGVANRYGITPLALAAVNGNETTVGLLLNAGADPNAASGEGETVLMAAARTGRPGPVKLLLDRGANVNAQEGHYGETALMWAAGHDHPEVVRLLIARGADPNARTKVLEFPKVKVDLATMVTTAMPRGGMTALILAARQGAIEGAMALADSGADLDLQDPDGTTAIVIAAMNMHFELAAKLAEKGANPNIADSAGMAALYAAVDMQQPDPLINRPPAKPTGRLSSVELVKVLLEHGANPNQPLKSPTLMRQHNTGDASLGNGATPLMRAAKIGDLDLMRLLMDNGADPKLAMANQTNTMMVILGGRGARTLTPETPAFQAIALCLDRGADVNAANANGETLLHLGVNRGEAFVKLLADRGARVDLKDKTGRTPLGIAMGVPPPAAPAGRGGARGGGAGPGRGGGAPPQRANEATIAILQALAKNATP
jgi:ankyrin repeat protein